MRVTFNSGFNQSTAALERVANDLARAQEQVSSGRRLNRASDDPSAAAGSVRERTELAALDQYKQTADSASARLSVIDTVLGDVLHRLTSGQTAILGVRGSEITEAQREAAASELLGIRDALFSNFNTTFRGTYLFSGTAATTAPYEKQPGNVISAYRGDADTTELGIDRETTVSVSYSADALARGGDAEDIFAALDDAIAAVRAGDDAGMGAGAAALERAFSRTSEAQSRAGTSMGAIEAQQGRVGSLRRASEARVAGYESANLAEAISRMTQADTAYRAALGAIGSSGRTSLMDYL